MKQKQKKFKNQKKLNKITFRWSLLNKILYSLVIFASAYYVVCANDLTVKGFVLKDLKVKLADLDEANKRLELIAYELSNTENINQRAQELKMVKVDKIEYFSAIPEVVARK